MRASSLIHRCSAKKAGKKLLCPTNSINKPSLKNGFSSSNNYLFINNLKTSFTEPSVDSKRFFSSSRLIRNQQEEEEPIEREVMEYDVVIVGAGPSGLSCAIKLKQLAQSSGKDISVCVLEKGQEVGSHLLSGACMETHSLEELFPNFRELDVPFYTAA